MQKQITLDVADDEFIHAKQAVLQAGFKLYLPRHKNLWVSGGIGNSPGV